MNASDYAFRNRTGETLIKPSGSINGNGFVLDKLHDCEVYILDHTSQVQVDDCINCKIFIGPTDGSVFLRDCRDCTVCVAARQLRTRDCKDIDIALYCATQPSIETSTGIVFSCWRGAYPGLTQHFKAARLDPARNTWMQVYDFNSKDDLGVTPHFRLDETVRPWWVAPPAPPAVPASVPDGAGPAGPPDCPVPAPDGSLFGGGRLDPPPKSPSGGGGPSLPDSLPPSPGRAAAYDEEVELEDDDDHVTVLPPDVEDGGQSFVAPAQPSPRRELPSADSLPRPRISLPAAPEDDAPGAAFTFDSPRPGATPAGAPPTEPLFRSASQSGLRASAGSLAAEGAPPAAAAVGGSGDFAAVADVAEGNPFADFVTAPAAAAPQLAPLEPLLLDDAWGAPVSAVQPAAATAAIGTEVVAPPPPSFGDDIFSHLASAGSEAPVAVAGATAVTPEWSSTGLARPASADVPPAVTATQAPPVVADVRAPDSAQAAVQLGAAPVPVAPTEEAGKEGATAPGLPANPQPVSAAVVVEAVAVPPPPAHAAEGPSSPAHFATKPVAADAGPAAPAAETVAALEHAGAPQPALGEPLASAEPQAAAAAVPGAGFGDLDGLLGYSGSGAVGAGGFTGTLPEAMPPVTAAPPLSAPQSEPVTAPLAPPALQPAAEDDDIFPPPQVTRCTIFAEAEPAPEAAQPPPPPAYEHADPYGTSSPPAAEDDDIFPPPQVTRCTIFAEAEPAPEAAQPPPPPAYEQADPYGTSAPPAAQAPEVFPPAPQPQEEQQQWSPAAEVESDAYDTAAAAAAGEPEPAPGATAPVSELTAGVVEGDARVAWRVANNRRLAQLSAAEGQAKQAAREQARLKLASIEQTRDALLKQRFATNRTAEKAGASSAGAGTGSGGSGSRAVGWRRVSELVDLSGSGGGGGKQGGAGRPAVHSRDTARFRQLIIALKSKQQK